MTKKTDLELPGDIFNIFLKPLAKKMGIRYIPRNSTLLLRSMFKKYSDKAEALDTKKLKAIQKSVEKIIGPAETIVKIFATFAKPLFAIIPPQYLVIILAVILIPTVFIPMSVVGMTVFYYLERWLKVPFVRSKREIDRVPKILQENTLTINRINKRTLTMSLKKWVDFNKTDRLDYYYETPADIKAKLLAVEKLLEIDPTQTSVSLPDWLLSFPGIPEELRTLDINEEVTVTRHTYYGWRTLLPPLLNRTVETTIYVLQKIQDNFFEDLETEDKWKIVLKVFFLGWVGFLV